MAGKIDSLETQMFTAIERNDLQTVQTLLEGPQGVSTEIRHPIFGDTPLAMPLFMAMSKLPSFSFPKELLWVQSTSLATQP